METGCHKPHRLSTVLERDFSTWDNKGSWNPEKKKFTTNPLVTLKSGLLSTPLATGKGGTLVRIEYTVCSTLY